MYSTGGAVFPRDASDAGKTPGRGWRPARQYESDPMNPLTDTTRSESHNPTSAATYRYVVDIKPLTRYHTDHVFS